MFFALRSSSDFDVSEEMDGSRRSDFEGCAFCSLIISSL
jgi:hypothetical protein